MPRQYFFMPCPCTWKKDLERLEKRALSIICPGLAYREGLKLLHTGSILDYIANLCKKTFSSIANVQAHRLYSMLPFSGPILFAWKGGLWFPNAGPNALRTVFLVRSCIKKETWFFGGLSNVNENEVCNVYI